MLLQGGVVGLHQSESRAHIKSCGRVTKRAETPCEDGQYQIFGWHSIRMPLPFNEAICILLAV
jgi:hypothetical protein